MTPQQMNAMMMRSGMNGGMPIGVGGHGGGPPPPQQQQHLGLQPPQIGGPPGGMPGMMQMAHAPGTMMSPQQQQMHVRGFFSVFDFSSHVFHFLF